MIEIINKYRGSTSRKVTDSTSYLICSLDAFETKCDEVQKAQKKGVVIVQEDFIQECIKAKCLLNVYRSKNAKFVLYTPPPHIQMSKLGPKRNQLQRKGKKNQKKKMSDGPNQKISNMYSTVATTTKALKVSMPKAVEEGMSPSELNSKLEVGNLILSNQAMSDKTLVWHDPAVFNSENQKYMQAFCAAGFRVEAFWGWQAAASFLKSNSEMSQKFVVLTSGTNGEKLVEYIRNFRNIHSVLVFCSNVEYHRTWAERHPIVSHVVSSNAEVTALTRELLSSQRQNLLKRSLSIIR